MGNQLKLIGQFLNRTHASQKQGIQEKKYRKLTVYNPKTGQEMAKGGSRRIEYTNKRQEKKIFKGKDHRGMKM